MADSNMPQTLGENPSRREILAHWDPENESFWKKFGERIAKQNLCVSTWALTLSFVVWTLWATIAAQLNQVGFSFTDAEIFTLASLPGLVGATCRLFYTYMPGLVGGKAPLLLGWNLSAVFGPPLINAAGQPVYLQNVCYFWAVPTVLTLVLIWAFMDNLPLPRQSPKSIFSIFGNKHTWLMTWIYTCGFGSFIGYSAALALLVNREFPEVSFAFAAFLGPFIGAGMRPVGGWLADKINNGSKITLYSLFVMLGACAVVLFGIRTHNFPLFFAAFLLLFLTTGFVNGASFRMIPYIFNNPFHSSLVTGFTAAIAAYGAFLIPKIFGWAYSTYDSVAPAFYLLIAFTVITIAITWFFYARKNSGIRC